uniref:Uncharacterized protein n=1 Tax=Arion vulgaris TaxID=1028688 RepID=A0A0B7B4X8_9EUPU
MIQLHKLVKGLHQCPSHYYSIDMANCVCRLNSSLISGRQVRTMHKNDVVVHSDIKTHTRIIDNKNDHLFNIEPPEMPIALHFYLSPDSTCSEDGLSTLLSP